MSNKKRLQEMIDEAGLLPIGKAEEMMSRRTLDSIINDFPVTYRHGVIHFKAEWVTAGQDCIDESCHIYKQGKRSFESRVEDHQKTLQKRGNGQDASRYAVATEHLPPVGQAYDWFHDVKFQVSDYGREVAHQIARLCGDDSMVTVSDLALADAVGKSDKTGQVSFIQRGVRELVESGWMSKEVTGSGSDKKTIYYLQAGEDTEYKKKWDDRFYEDDTYLSEEYRRVKNHHIV